MTVDRIGQEPREDIPPFDLPRAEAAVRELLIAVGEDPEREGLRETPARVAWAYQELLVGMRTNPEEVLTTTFDMGHDEMILVKDIELWSMCEHHLVPFTGSRTSGTSRRTTAGSPACPSWPGWSTCTPAGPRSRSG